MIPVCSRTPQSSPVGRERTPSVLQLYARAQKDDAEVTEAAAHAARNLRRYDFSIQLYRHSEALAPERWQSRLGEAMVLADKGDYNQPQP